MDWLEGLIKSADKLGNLSAGAIWAFIVVYFIWDAKQKKESSDKAWAARTEEAKADQLMASAIEKMAEELNELRQEIRFGRKGV